MEELMTFLPDEILQKIDIKPHYEGDDEQGVERGNTTSAKLYPEVTASESSQETLYEPPAQRPRKLLHNTSHTSIAALADKLKSTRARVYTPSEMLEKVKLTKKQEIHFKDG